MAAAVVEGAVVLYARPQCWLTHRLGAHRRTPGQRRLAAPVVGYERLAATLLESWRRGARVRIALISTVAPAARIIMPVLAVTTTAPWFIVLRFVIMQLIVQQLIVIQLVGARVLVPACRRICSRPRSWRAASWMAAAPKAAPGIAKAGSSSHGGTGSEAGSRSLGPNQGRNRMGRLGGGPQSRPAWLPASRPAAGNVRGLHQTGPAVEHRGAGAAAHQAIADPQLVRHHLEGGAAMRAAGGQSHGVARQLCVQALRPCRQTSRRARQTDMAIHGA